MRSALVVLAVVASILVILALIFGYVDQPQSWRLD